MTADDLIELVRAYNPRTNDRLIRKAFAFGEKMHEGQHRQSGEPYFSHPVSVAAILTEQRLDDASIITALLHDTIEDTKASYSVIADTFGDEIAKLVDGVTKLSRLELQSEQSKHAENFRKLVLAMSEDIRVLLVKLADRLHNMRTIEAMPVDKRRRIARETLDIYAPIANRLGINTLKHELEDLAFATLYPMRHRVLSEAVRRARGNRKELMQKIEIMMAERLQQEGVEADVRGREKPVYSMYRKMREKHLAFQEVFDKFAIRVIVDSVEHSEGSSVLIDSPMQEAGATEPAADSDPKTKKNAGDGDDGDPPGYDAGGSDGPEGVVFEVHTHGGRTPAGIDADTPDPEGGEQGEEPDRHGGRPVQE